MNNNITTNKHIQRALEEAKMQAHAKHMELDSMLTNIQREYEAKLMFVWSKVRPAQPHRN